MRDDRTFSKLGAARTPDDTERQLRALYGDAHGWCCVAYIDGDPGDQKNRPVEDWEYYTRKRVPFIAQRIRELAAQYGNVYIGLCLHACTRRIRETALPSCWLWNDDVPDGDCSAAMVVRSSAGSRQVYIRLAEAVDVEARRDLQGRMKAALKSGAGSTDAIKLVRAVGGFNTKKHGRYPVTLELLNGQTSTLEELHARWPTIPQSLMPITPELNWEAVAQWQTQLDALCRVVDGQRIPERVKDGKQTYFVLMRQLDALPDYLRPEIYKADGTPDWSMMRMVVANGMRAVGYPDAVIAAFLIEECDYGRSDHGKGELEKDIVRVIKEAHKKRPRIIVRTPRIGPEALVEQRQNGTHDTAHGHQAAAPPIPNHLSLPKGRPVTISADAVLAWYGENRDLSNYVLKSQGEVAHILGVGVATIRRREKELQTRGLIERVVLPGRQGSYVSLSKALSGAITSPDASADDGEVQALAGLPEDVLSEPSLLAENDLQPTATADMANDVLSEQMSDLGNMNHESLGACVFLMPDLIAPLPMEACSSPAGEATERSYESEPDQERPMTSDQRPTPDSQRPNLRALVADAFDAYPGRIRLPAVTHYVRANGGVQDWSDAAIERTYRAELQQRKRRRDAERVARNARELSWSALKHRATTVGQIAAERQRKGASDWRFWMWCAGQLEGEITRRLEQARTSSDD